MSALAFLKLRRNNSPGECTILVNNVCSRFWGIFIKFNKDPPKPPIVWLVSLMPIVDTSFIV